MIWEIVGATGEWAGALAVVITLFYLARQIRSSTAQATSEAESASQQEFITLQNGLIEDERTISVMRRGFHSFSSLSDDEKYIFHMKLSTFINYFEGVLRRAEKGFTSPNIVRTFGNVVVTLVGSRGGREFWEIAGGTFQELSTRYINDHMDDGDWASMTEIFPYFIDSENRRDVHDVQRLHD